ncbi:MAG: ABC transporter ATP-binding protein [Sumerlaeia bacterium]
MKSLLALLPYCKPYKMQFLFGIIFVLIAKALDVVAPKLVGDAINMIDAGSANLEELPSFVGFILVVSALAGCFTYLMRRVLIDTSRDIEFDFRNSVYKKLQSLDASYYDQNSTGDVMSRMTNDIDVVRTLIGPAIMYTANTVFALPLVLIAMLSLDWQTTLVGLVPMILMPFLVKFFGAKLHCYAREQQDRMGDMTTYVQESLSGIRVIKAYGREETYAQGFRKENDAFVDASLKYSYIQTLFFPSIRFTVGLGLLGILYMGGTRIVNGTMQFGDLVALVLYFGMMVFPFIAAGWVINIFQRASAAMERLQQVLNTESRIVDSAKSAEFVLPEKLDFELINLTFRYEGANHDALQNTTINIPEGTRVGIVGRVGSGKSTLVHLLLRLYPVERGMIKLGGIDLNDWPLVELRRQVGIVFQETVLFSNSIAKNIRFGALQDLTLDDIQRVATIADVHKDIQDFPKAYDTMLGERGINLSGGQKQRVSLARTISRNSRLLILDDSLSAVDTHTEEAILKELSEVMKNRTTFLISHRISTVALSDVVIVLEDGKIIQQGTHEQLLQQEGLYKELFEKQQLEAEVLLA